MAPGNLGFGKSSTTGFTIGGFPKYLKAAFHEPSFLALLVKMGGQDLVSQFSAQTIKIKFDNDGVVFSKESADPILEFQNTFEFYQLLNPLNQGALAANLPRQPTYPPNSFEARCLPVTEAKQNVRADTLEKHHPRVKNIYFGRGDLQAMYALNLLHPNKEWFFSGAELNFSTMHNSALQVERFTTKQNSGSTILVPDASICFTLKAELIPAETYSDFYSAAGFSGNNLSNSSNASGASVKLPAAILGKPCPTYWNTIPELVEEAEPAFIKHILEVMASGPATIDPKELFGQVNKARQRVAHVLAGKDFSDLDSPIVIPNPPS